MREFVKRERSYRKKRNKDPVQMEIRVRRCDELFLIHREPLPDETEKKPRRIVNRKAKKKKPPKKTIQYSIPTMDREVKQQPIGEYLLKAEPHLVDKLKTELNNQEEYSPRTMEEVLDLPPPQEEDPPPTKGQRQQTRGVRRSNRQTKPPDKLKYGELGEIIKEKPTGGTCEVTATKGLGPRKRGPPKRWGIDE